MFNITVVTRLFRLNGIDDYKVPKLRHSALAGQGLETTMKSIMDLLKLDMLDKEDPVLQDHIKGLLGIPKGATQVEQNRRAEREEEDEEEDPEELGDQLEPEPTGNGFSDDPIPEAVVGQGADA